MAHGNGPAAWRDSLALHCTKLTLFTEKDIAKHCPEYVNLLWDLYIQEAARSAECYQERGPHTYLGENLLDITQDPA